MHKNGSNRLTDFEQDLLNGVEGLFEDTSPKGNNKRECSVCNGDTFVDDYVIGLKVCITCGTVLDLNIMDASPEWKTGEDGSNNGRCGMATNALLPQLSMVTSIGKCNRMFKSLQNWNSIPNKERSLNGVLNMITAKCECAGLMGCIEDDTKIMYKIATDCKLEGNLSVVTRGRNRTGLVAACLFYACKRNGHTKSLKDIAKLFDIKSSKVNKGCKNFIRYVKYKNIDYSTDLSHPIQYVKQICDGLKIESNIIEKITTITQCVQHMNIVSSHTPMSVAVACVLVYTMAHNMEGITPNILAIQFGVSAVTISKIYGKLHPYRDTLLNPVLYERTLASTIANAKPIETPAYILIRLRGLKAIDCGKYQSNREFNMRECLGVSIIDYVKLSNGQCIDYVNAANAVLRESFGYKTLFS
jgi:transcription initiation factor TFIIB